MTTLPRSFSSSIFSLEGMSPGGGSRERLLEEENRALRQRMTELDAEPTVIAAVLASDGRRVQIHTGTQCVEVPSPLGLKGIERGALVRIRLGAKAAITEILGDTAAVGVIVSVSRRVDDSTVEVLFQGQAKAIADRTAAKKGDRIVLDMTGSVVAKNLGKADNSRAWTADTGVAWEDVGGQDDAKRALIEAIEEPSRHAALYRRYGRRPVRGILLWGPPGTGKTLLGKACATSLARTHGASAKGGGFIYVKGPELLNMFVGKSEENIRQVFAQARDHKEREGYPAIVFVDEADAIMGRRGASRLEGMERTVVPQFLAEMDGLEDAGALVLLATNRPDQLDPAVTRDGRIDRRVEVRRPNEPECSAIFRIHLARCPLMPGASLDGMADEFARALFDDRHALYVVRTKDGKDRRFGLRDLASGALVAGLADRAAQQALRRELAGAGPRGLSAQDCLAAVAESLGEMRGLDHTTDLQLFVEGLEVARIDRAK